MNIGIVIKEIRKQKGITQLELSEYTNLSERTIQRIENHEVEPSLYSLKSIGTFLEVNLVKIKQKVKIWKKGCKGSNHIWHPLPDHGIFSCKQGNALELPLPSLPGCLFLLNYLQHSEF